MALRIKKMDKRNTGWSRFSHYVEFYTPMPMGMRAKGMRSSSVPPTAEHYNRKYVQFIECRNWCWENWGPSAERDLFNDNYKGPGLPICNNWAWYTEHSQIRIYLASEAEVGMFALHWNLS